LSVASPVGSPAALPSEPVAAPMPPLRVVALYGSPSTPSRSAALLRGALPLLAGRSIVLFEVEVRNLPAQALLHARADEPAVAQALAQVVAADLLLVTTPIYKAAYSGVLKLFLDLLPPDALRGKRVLPLATGGSVAHLLAVDYALRPVLVALGAREILDTVFATDAQFDAAVEGGWRPDAVVRERLQRALATARIDRLGAATATC
jgi:FMN reductase